MSDVAAPGWARLTGRDLGRLRRPFKGGEKGRKEKNFLSPVRAQKDLPTPARNLRQIPLMADVRRVARSIEIDRRVACPRLALAFRRRPRSGDARPQRGAARAGVVKHLPLFFDLAGRRVVVVGRGPPPSGAPSWRARPVPRCTSSDAGRPAISNRVPPPSSSPPAISRAITLPSAPPRRPGFRSTSPTGRRSAISSCRRSSIATMSWWRSRPAAPRPPWRRCCAAASRRRCPSASARWRGSPRPSAPRPTR